MAQMKPETIAVPARGFAQLPAVRQIAMLVGLAASIALGFSIVLWSRTPSFQPLYGSLSHKEAAEVIDALQKTEIPYRLDEATGVVMVPGAHLHNARIRLATEGFPRGSAVGFELLEKSKGFGVSQFMESARYQRALEGELARSIASLRSVKSARVHLAIPKQSSFIRNRKSPSASVVINLYSGRQLDDEQLAGIVHLVSSSIPELAPEGVSVIDQQGRLLSAASRSREIGLDHSQLSYNRRVEEAYVERIENILTPIVGMSGVRAQVVADIDFTVTEKTSETFDPEKRQVRSEDVQKSERVGAEFAVGVPGALSNQPPAAGTTSSDAAQDVEQDGDAASGAPKSRSQRSTHNYELDKTISHVKLSTGTIRRLSVAVVIDDRSANEGRPSAAEADNSERLTTLVKQAVGFDETRGDTVTVVSIPFTAPDVPEPLPEPPLWERSWVHDALKQLVAVIAVLLLIFFVLRPTMRALATRGGKLEVLPGQAGMEGLASAGADAQLAGPTGLLGRSAANYEQELEAARHMVSNDPKRVAQVVKNWVGEND